MRTSRQASAWIVGLAVLLTATSAEAIPATKVFLNGVPTPVYFNDGDSFRVLAGRLRGTRARLKGFNTLESYGPVHQWGTWTRQELSNYATLGTLNARRGVWRCTSDMKKDFYGRFLWDCPDLAVDQVRKGYAHALTVTSQPAAARLLTAQMEAITAKRGFWAHGIPDFVMTSTHSTTEGWKPYNRLVSSYKGFSKKWKHRHAYRECQTVCVAQSDVSADKVKAFIPTLRANPTLQKALAGVDDAAITALVTEFVTQGLIVKVPNESSRYVLETLLSYATAAGKLTQSGKIVSCMVYVEFKRRYGGDKATCLR